VKENAVPVAASVFRRAEWISRTDARPISQSRQVVQLEWCAARDRDADEGARPSLVERSISTSMTRNAGEQSDSSPGGGLGCTDLAVGRRASHRVGL